MSISYHSDGTPVIRSRSGRLLALMAFNATFAGIMLTAWTAVALFVAEPLSWATWMPVYQTVNMEQVIRYPFVVLWLWPLMGIAGGWLAVRCGRPAIAYACVALPMVVLALVFGWYYLTPADWR